MGEIHTRRNRTNRRIKTIKSKLEYSKVLCKNKACVYVTGSFGRLEAGKHSDLDLFIVSNCTVDEASGHKRISLLKRLDEICVKADLIEMTRELKFPEFSKDGQYLVHYPVDKLTGTLGKPEDDVENTFTARLLLLLESKPLLEDAIYADVVSQVITPYWRDFENHKKDFIPAFLANDILRLWRTFCVNYEARTQTEPDEKRFKRKVVNYKLKYSRMLTCYSALIFLLGVYRSNNTVTPEDALSMARMTPTERLEELAGQQKKPARRTLLNVLEEYETFLRRTNISEDQLVEIMADTEVSKEYMESGYKFGDLIFDALNLVGAGNRFHRLLVV